MDSFKDFLEWYKDQDRTVAEEAASKAVSLASRYDDSDQRVAVIASEVSEATALDVLSKYHQWLSERCD